MPQPRPMYEATPVSAVIKAKLLPAQDSALAAIQCERGLDIFLLLLTDHHGPMNTWRWERTKISRNTVPRMGVPGEWCHILFHRYRTTQDGVRCVAYGPAEPKIPTAMKAELLTFHVSVRRKPLHSPNSRSYTLVDVDGNPDVSELSAFECSMGDLVDVTPKMALLLNTAKTAWVHPLDYTTMNTFKVLELAEGVAVDALANSMSRMSTSESHLNAPKQQEGILMSTESSDLHILMIESNGGLTWKKTKLIELFNEFKLGDWVTLTYCSTPGGSSNRIKVMKVKKQTPEVPTRLIDEQVHFKLRVKCGDDSDPNGKPHFLCELGPLDDVAPSEAARLIEQGPDAVVMAWCYPNMDTPDRYSVTAFCWSDVQVNGWTEMEEKTPPPQPQPSKVANITTPKQQQQLAPPPSIGVICSIDVNNDNPKERIFFLYSDDFPLEVMLDPAQLKTDKSSSSCEELDIGDWLEFCVAPIENVEEDNGRVTSFKRVKELPFDTLAGLGTIFISCRIEVPADITLPTKQQFITRPVVICSEFTGGVKDINGLLKDKHLGSMWNAVIGYCYTNGEKCGSFVLEYIGSKSIE